MKRMTERSERGNAYYPQCFKEPCEGMGCKIEQCKFSEAYCDRLAAYEDSGLSPEDAANLHAILKLGDGMTLMRLRELAVADQEGRVIVLPCKVYETDGARVYEHTVREVIYETAGGPAFDKNAIGKSIFLTRAEAERALAEMESHAD